MVLSLILGLLMETEASSSSYSNETREELKQRVCPVCMTINGLSVFPNFLCEKCITIMKSQWDGHRRDAVEAEQSEQSNLSTVVIFLSVLLVAIFFGADVLRDCWTWAFGSFTSGISRKDDQ